MDFWVACVGVLAGLLGIWGLAAKGKGCKYQKLGFVAFGILAAAGACYLLLTLLLLGGIS